MMTDSQYKALINQNLKKLNRDSIYHSGRQFLDNESGTIYSLYDLLLIYELNAYDFFIDSGCETFYQWLNNCTDKNGQLEEFTTTK